MSIQSYSQCNTGIQLNGTAYTPNYSGNEETITDLQEPNGHYANVNVLANRFYTFYAYEAGSAYNGYKDYITITDASGTVLDFGPSPFIYRSWDYSGVIRCYYHSNSACQTNNIDKRILMTSATSLCIFPANLNETNVTSSSATLHWDEQNPVPDNGYQYYIVYDNTSPPMPPANSASSGVTGFTLNTSVTLNNLSPNRHYYWWVRSSCGSKYSVWVEGGNFITPAIVCNQPTGFVVNNVTANSALFSWQAPSQIPSDGYNFAFNLTGATPIVADTFYPLATSQFVSNLASNTTYYYFVRSDCGNVVSSWVFGGSFTTPIGFNCNAATYGLKPSATYTPICTGSPETIASDSRAGEYANIAIQSNKEYTFASSIATDYITITNESGSVLYATGITPLVWQSGSNSGIVRYFLHANSSCGNNQTNRSRTISCAPSAGCLPPSNLTSYNVGSNVASISWTASASNPTGGYDVYFSTSSTAPTAGTTPNGNINATAATINNLSPATTYYFWVRSNCDGMTGTWVSGGSFTTTALTCNAPSNIIKSNITSSSAQINWTAASPTPSNGYQLYYSTVNSAPISSTTPTATSTNTNTTISSLTSVTTYYIWVRSNCGGSQSAWVSGGNFTTLAAACNPPSNLISSGITSNTAQITWTAASPTPAQYDVYFSTSSTTPNASTTPVGSLVGVAADLINLTTSTTYYFWVRSNCGATTSTWISGGSFTTTAQGDCTEAIYGQYPDTQFTPTCTGSNQIIVSDAYASEFCFVDVYPNRTYTFTSSVATDHITIVSGDESVVYARGTTPLVWQSGAITDVVRYFIHTNASCGAQNVNRVKSVKCTNTLAVHENEVEGLQVFPNPTVSILNIKHISKIDTVEITNLIGQSILQQQIQATDGVINLTHYPSGIYLVKVSVGNTSQTFKIIKN
ncbi:fibronectin type III domain-containing protein [Flavobacterium sp.]|uniref:fibronectin type III domain-containing protein n=1 Tax=Flavobacterium sp. TaxID=239 RepID=UPI00286A6276|nr:fibronectin type III domain-containing protein [Flavobacterium sp.]